MSAQLRIDLTSNQILAADLAAAVPQAATLDNATVLAHAPIPGVDRRIGRLELARWLETAGLQVDPESLPETLIVARKMRSVGAEEIRNIVRESIAARYEVDPERVEIDLHTFAEPFLPNEGLRFELGTPIVRLSKPVTLSVRWSSPSGSNGILSFRATTRIRGSYATARETIERGSEIAPADFEIVEGYLPGDPNEYQVSAEDLRGQQLRQRLKAGALLEKRLLRRAMAVKRGDMIEIRVEAKSVVLRAPARAEDSGSPGEVIRCRNLQSNTTVRAVIVDAGQAEVP